MKLIGRRSAASGLRWVLGLVNVFVVIGIIGLGIVVLTSWAQPEFASGFTDGLAAAPAAGPDASTVKRFYYLGGLISLGFLWLILNRLRRIFLSVNRGDAFEGANVRRLQAVGLGLAGMELASLFTNLFAPLLDGGHANDFDVDLKMWVAILVVFILAEVFRQGAQMRDDAAMTV